MEIKLKKKPRNCILIEGFPGFGLVGTIASEFLAEHLGVELIGTIAVTDSQPMAAIHEGKLVQPVGIYYSKKHSIILLNAIIPATGTEWKFAQAVQQLAKQLQIKEIICLEGVGSQQASSASRVFYYSNTPAVAKKLVKAKVEPLKEGIIIGVTGALLLSTENMPISCIFAETHTNLPDSKAAAKLIEVLDKYLGFKLDYKPLLEQAAQFENKLKTIMADSQKTQELADAKKLSYVG